MTNLKRCDVYCEGHVAEEIVYLGDGAFVDADVAEALYEALDDITGEAAFEGLPEETQDAIEAALAKARGETQ